MFGEIRAGGETRQPGGVRRGSRKKERAQKRRKERRGWERDGVMEDL